MNGKTLTLKPGVGSANTKSNGIRVLAYSKLEIKNGTVVCSDETADNIKVGIANYSELVLDSVTVKAGALTVYTINNRGNLTLKGTTSVENAKVAQTDYPDSTDYIAITNDPYHLYYSEPINAVITSDDSRVNVGNIQLATYGSKGNIELNISGGTFGGIYAPAGGGSVEIIGNVTGGTFAENVQAYIAEGYQGTKDENGNIVVGPVMGTVTTLTGGTIEGNGTGAVTVTIDDVTLNWSAADDTIGRAQGWWVGIKVEAPADMDASALEDAVYQSKSGPASDWSANKSFWSNKDSKDTDDTHNIQLWFPVTPASLEKFKDEGRNITMWYRFDWDHDGSFEQSITFSVDPTGNIVLNKVDQTGFGFAVETPADIWVGDVTYQNVATGGQGDGAITYEIISGDAATIDAATGVLTFTKAGTVTVKATKAADSDGYYNAVSAQYTVTATQKDQYPKFEKTSPDAITYAPGLTFENAVQDVLGGNVTYSIVDEDKNGAGVAKIDTATGELTILKAGTVTVKATIEGNVGYLPAEITYTLVIEKADQSFTFNHAEDIQRKYGQTPYETKITVSELNSGKVSYAVSENTIGASVDADGVVSFVNSTGKVGTVTVTVTMVGDDCYNEFSDTYTITFTLTDDGDYVVSVQYEDKSGNQMNSYTSNKLTLDTTAPTIQVSDIKANSANKDAEYSFVIEVSDINLDATSIKPVLKAVKQNAEGVYEVVEIDLGKAAAVVNGQTYTYTIDNLPDDGLYTLTCEVKDMSANGMSQIVLEDGNAYDQVQFSINRNGSAFGYGDSFAEELAGQYYVYSVDEDVVVVEVNVDPIEEYSVTLNGKKLTEGTDYTSVQASNTGEWSKRIYTISKDLFIAEGEYSIIVSSVDKTDTTAFSDVKNLSMAFVVDQTKPVLTITGLEAGGRYLTDAQTVTLIPADEGGRLRDLSVVVLDSNGNPLKDKETGEDISVRFDMSGEELLKYLEENDGKVTFTIPEGLNNQVSIICNDCAVNADNLTNEYNELFGKVTVSQNELVIFYANTHLFIGTIVGVLAVIALIIILIKRKKDKKNRTRAKV